MHRYKIPLCVFQLSFWLLASIALKQQHQACRPRNSCSHISLLPRRSSNFSLFLLARSESSRDGIPLHCEGQVSSSAAREAVGNEEVRYYCSGDETCSACLCEAQASDVSWLLVLLPLCSVSTGSWNVTHGCNRKSPVCYWKFNYFQAAAQKQFNRERMQSRL